MNTVESTDSDDCYLPDAVKKRLIDNLVPITINVDAETAVDEAELNVNMPSESGSQQLSDCSNSSSYFQVCLTLTLFHVLQSNGNLHW